MCVIWRKVCQDFRGLFPGSPTPATRPAPPTTKERPRSPHLCLDCPNHHKPPPPQSIKVQRGVLPHTHRVSRHGRFLRTSTGKTRSLSCCDRFSAELTTFPVELDFHCGCACSALSAHRCTLSSRHRTDLPLFRNQLSLITIILASLPIAIAARRDEPATKSMLWCRPPSGVPWLFFLRLSLSVPPLLDQNL